MCCYCVAIVLLIQWLWEGGTLTVLSRMLLKHRRFRHCLSLDTAVLQVCVCVCVCVCVFAELILYSENTGMRGAAQLVWSHGGAV
jgi:hypothetical protein